MSNNINDTLDTLERGVRELRDHLRAIAGIASGGAVAGADGGRVLPMRRVRRTRPAAAKVVEAPAPPKRQQRKMSPKLRAVRILQGRYMGAVRHLKVGQKAQVKKLKEAKGYHAALKLAAKLASGGAVQRPARKAKRAVRRVVRPKTKRATVRTRKPATAAAATVEAAA